MSWSDVVRAFSKYSAVGVTAFGADLALLALLVEAFDVPYQVAVPTCFLIVTSIQHGITRHFVFPASTRSYKSEYAHFLLISIVTAGLVTAVTVGLAEYLALNIYLSRVAAAGVGGVWSFYANARYNFRAL